MNFYSIKINYLNSFPVVTKKKDLYCMQYNRKNQLKLLELSLIALKIIIIYIVPLALTCILSVNVVQF